MAHRSSHTETAGAVPGGLFNIDKPQGITSRVAVDRVQRITGIRKAGHAGTLDPLASGVLVVAVGASTRLIQFVQQLPKQYRAQFLLGRQSDTEDTTGNVTELIDPPVPTVAQLCEAAAAFTGEIEQRPPAFSALKVHGRRAYELARQGNPVELRPRRVEVYELEVLAYDYPVLELGISCSGGTYVRSLGRDLAAHLGSAAVMSRLVRTAVGTFALRDAVPLDALSAENWRHVVLPPARAVEHLPSVQLDPEEIRRVRQGQTIQRPHLAEKTQLAGLDQSGNLVAVLQSDGTGRLRSVKNLPPR